MTKSVINLIEKAAGECDHAHNELHRAVSALKTQPSILREFIANSISNLNSASALLAEADLLLANHPRRSNLSYPSPAPVFADANYMAEIIGHAATAAEAVALYTAYYAGTGASAVTKALKACPDRKGDGPVDGWVPEFAAE